jgi:hypothetical protein
MTAGTVHVTNLTPGVSATLAGGHVQCVEVSAHSGLGMEDLEMALFLEAEVRVRVRVGDTPLPLPGFTVRLGLRGPRLNDCRLFYFILLCLFYQSR